MDKTPWQSQPLTMIPGVGPARRAALHHLGIDCVADLLHYFPFRYDEDTKEHEFSAETGTVVVVASVAGEARVRFVRGKSLLSLPVVIHDTPMQAIFFNQSYLRNQFSVGMILRLYGRYDATHKTLTVTRHERPSKHGALRSMTPVYAVSSSISVITLRQIMNAALRRVEPQLRDALPGELVARFRLPSYCAALRMIHFPDTLEDVHQARRRLVFEEFLRYQFHLQLLRETAASECAAPLDPVRFYEGSESFVRALPFQLTDGQRSALAALSKELIGTVPMRRLLQGDVGSGKTAVAFALAAGLTHTGQQTVLMAPTAILAEQHYRDAVRMLKPLGVTVALKTSESSESTVSVNPLKRGECTEDLIIGTHTLASPTLSYRRLRLAVIDEQHRFGVGIRRALREKGEGTSVLHLSATPIPRSLALTLYGDLAVTTLRERPKDRLPIKTMHVSTRDQTPVFRLLRTELMKGHQAYIVAPRIRPDDVDEEMKSAEELYEVMVTELGAARIALVHGQMNDKDRQQVMREFVAGHTQVLVATSMIEVGVSVENATVMIVYGAERFGLATLHQLRGRVGRSIYPSYCMLVTDPVGNKALERIDALLSSQDGFALAERDLSLRGPGELLGARQSGLPTFSIGDPLADLRIMEAARDTAESALRDRSFWLLPSYQDLRESVLRDLLQKME
ncbi:ATP-dependent DNA helicase RecG [Ferroacidibacillus organovorans]|uniref:Probable DNA 3'-5' helicase RecG n=1 Tax=Ferroacidibacillus organovorans TaxID=1765683 RepID=A0A1V4ETI1_9BACL|nr:ATP-dependent DNA helicase RecG [Ferroacidibacillus organovorans]OPG16172.1 hypothetical protein B2M26_07605 [Ferroacidibacillus organovorans]